MTKRLFQRILALLIFIIVFFIYIPSIFKDILLFIIAIALFISTFEKAIKKDN